MPISYYNPKQEIRLSAYADTIVLEPDGREQRLRAIRFGGYPEMVRAMSDAIYAGATLETEFADQMTTDYTLRNLNTFLILGLWGFIHADDQEDISEKTMNEVCALIQDLMTSNIFRKRKPEDPYQTAGRLEESESNPGPEASQSKRTADTSLPVRNEDASVQVRSENSSQRVLESDPKAAVSEAVSSEETSPAASVSDAAVSRTVPSQAAVLKAAASAASGRGSD